MLFFCVKIPRIRWGDYGVCTGFSKGHDSHNPYMIFELPCRSFQSGFFDVNGDSVMPESQMSEPVELHLFRHLKNKCITFLFERKKYEKEFFSHGFSFICII